MSHASSIVPPRSGHRPRTTNSRKCEGDFQRRREAIHNQQLSSPGLTRSRACLTSALRTAATLSESLLADMAPPVAGQTDESEAVIAASVLNKWSKSETSDFD